MNEIEPEEPGSGETRPEDFVAPRNDGSEPSNNPPEETSLEPTPEESEKLNTELVESPEMVEFRQQAFNHLEDLRQSIDTLGPEGHIIRDTFLTDYLEQYLELGRAEIENMVLENRELANLQLEAWLGRFQQECGFQSNGIARQEIISNQLIKEGRKDLADQLLNFWTESKQTWVKSVRVEPKVSQEQIDRFLQGVTIEPLDEEAPEQYLNCQLTEQVGLEEFKSMVKQAIVPRLNNNGKLWVRGDGLPPEYLQALAEDMDKWTDYPVIAVYDKSSGEYKTIRDEGGEDQHDSEPTIANLAEACRELLDKESLEALAECIDFDEAIGLALTMLIENGIDDPEQFLREMGLIE